MAEANDKESKSGEWARRYPPLLTMLVALILAVVVLPSSLNLPQTNPTQTLEFAPVPPDDKTDPQQGNTSALGAGDSSTIGAEGLGGDGNGPSKPPPPPPNDPNGNRVDIGTQCVGKPPRQTLDPLAPPCVPFWDKDSDNGGATYKGVTPSEVRVLIAFDGAITYTGASDKSNRAAPSNKIFDLNEDGDTCRTNHNGDAGCTFLVTQGFRVWQKYFNDRFQTYGRFVHFFVSYSGGADATPDRRRAEAAFHLKEVDPFAVVSFLSEGAEDDYLQAMARKGVLNFGSFGLRDSAFFNLFPGLIWSYLPSIEQYSTSYINYVCRQVIASPPKPANLAGGTLANLPRKIGMIYTTNRFQQGLVKLAGLVKQGVKDCGGDIVDEIPFQNCCLARDNGDPPDEEQQQMARFQSEGITTILWPGGGNANFAQSAKALEYAPEWIVAGGDGFQDNSTYLFYSQGEDVYDGHAIAISPHALEPALDQQICFQAFREIDQAFARADLGYICGDYKNIFQLFTGIQVAGPFLGPSQVNKGFHAIPQKQSSTDPRVPACFYLRDDYTCVKDAVALIYDAKGQAPGSNLPGCYRALNNGKRYLPADWPMQQVAADAKPNDPCTGYSAATRFNLQ